MKKAVKPAQRAERDEPVLPGQVIGSLLDVIKNQFCGHMDAKTWSQWFHFLRREVVTWPAAFMWKKGFALPVDRFERIMLGILRDIKIHGDTGRINFVPGYLQRCVRQHFLHNWETYYAEAKASRTVADLVMLGLRKAQGEAQDREGTKTIADAHSVLKAARREKTRKPAGEQLDLF